MLCSDSDLKQHFLNNLPFLQDVISQGHSRKIYLVPKAWYDRLHVWLTYRNAPRPGVIDNSPLLLAGHLNPAVVHQKDFELVDGAIWTALVEVFTCPNPIPRRLTIHPVTLACVILLNPVQLEIFTESRGWLHKVCSRDWTFADIRPSLCAFLHVPVTTYFFSDWRSGKPVDDVWEIGHFVERRGPKLKLLAGHNPIGGKTFSVSQKALKSLSAPTFTEDDFPRGLDHNRKAGSCYDVGFPKLIGLVNLDNDCYLNSTLQCLIRMPLLADFALSPGYIRQINVKNPLGTGGSVAREFYAFLREMCVTNLTGLCNAAGFKQAICAVYNDFSDGGQHDAQEFLSVVIDKLDEDLSTLNYAQGRLTPRSEELKAAATMKPISMIGELFYGQFLTTISCPNCGHRHESYDQFLCLSLPVPSCPRSAVLMCDLLSDLFKKDDLDQDNLWFCAPCQSKVRASSQTAIYHAPQILVIHFKRFQASSGVPRKINTDIEFPENLDMAKFSQTSCGNYKLLGVIMHTGGTAAGHYTAAAIDPISGKWYQFNDTNVTLASDQVVHSARAYLLFYQRID
jgi:ubiquitin carboxyl-terminal hydrolase 8